jgi:2-polyprenyl-3-methyl-5-hydroxy-6-metoxy-1,4-benzoquinol methylase
MNVSHRLPELKEDASDNVKVMFVAWRMAQISDASSPGHLYAYYALEFEGYLFPGERPWVDRWGMLRAITDYSGKKIIELGCNMGLLTSYLMKYEGAKGALAVDMDEKIIEAAELVNNSLNVKVEHAIVNFDSKEEWEEELLEYKPDIVFALNVLNWVDDKERLLKFLGHFNKLIFEGHDSLEVEKSRLQNIGYKKISVITRTERNRAVLFCEK